MAGRTELDRGRGLRAKCKSLSKPTWNHHESQECLSKICVKFCFLLTKPKTWFQTKNFYFCMTNTLRRTQNLNLCNSRMSWYAQWLSCCKNIAGWRLWYQERLVLISSLVSDDQPRTAVVNIGACGAVPAVAPKRTGSGPGIVTIISLWQLGSNKNSSLPLF